MTTQEISAQTLPVWMRKAQRGADWGIMLALAFSFALALSFLLQSSLPPTNASENYVFLTADYVEALGEGRLYPRWSANALGGYGAPIPHFYPPLAPYTAALFDIFLTGDPVSAVRVVYTIAFCLAGTAMYMFVQRRADSATGLIASMLYVSSPYIGRTAPHILGDFPGMIGLALLPALLWSSDRVLLRNRTFDVALVMLTTALLILTDLRYAAAGIVLALLLTLWQLTQERSRRWLLALIGGILGLGLASFYWLPALAESNYVTWQANGFAPLRELQWPDVIAPLQRIDSAAMFPTPHFTIGVGGLIALIFGGLALLLKKSAGRSFHALYLVCGLLILFIALRFFPTATWLLGVATFCLAIGGSGLWSLRLFITETWHRPLLAAIVVALLFAALPVWMVPRQVTIPQNPTPRAQVAYELNDYGVAVLPSGAPIPLSISPRLQPNRALLNSYQSGTISKISNEYIAGTGQVGLVAHMTHSDRFQVQIGSAATLDIQTAYFPGWQAWLNNAPIPLRRNPANGLMQLSLPSGSRGELRISFESTPIRIAAWAISALVIGIIVTLTIGRLRHAGDTFDDLQLLSIAETRLLSLVVAVFTLMMVLLVPLPHLHPRPGFALDNRGELLARTGDVGLEALAYDLDRRTYRPGETVDFTVYWRTLKPLLENYQVRAGLARSDATVILPSTPPRHPGGYPTQRWLLDRYVPDTYSLTTSPNLTPGQYVITLTVLTCDPVCLFRNRLTFYDQSNIDTGQTLFLPPFITFSDE